MDAAPNTLADALEALSTARADLSALDALNAEHKAAVELLEATKRDNAALVLAVASLESEREQLLSAVAALKATEADANQKAAEIVASLGVEPAAVVTSEVSSGPKTRQELEALCATLSNPLDRAKARNEFLNRQS